MTGHDGLRMQRVDFVERMKPFVASVFVGLCEIKVGVVVDAVTGYNERDRRDIKRGCVGRVSMAELDHLQFLSFKVKGIAFEDLWRRQIRWDLAGKASSQKDFMNSGLICS